MPTNKWPEDGSPAYCGYMIEEIYKAIKFAYNLRRKNKGKDIPYEGFEIGEEEQVGSYCMNEKLSAQNLEWQLEDQGRDAMEVILEGLFQLGVEQGRRMERNKIVNRLPERLRDKYLESI